MKVALAVPSLADDAENTARDDTQELRAHALFKGDLGFFPLQEGIRTDNVDGVASRAGYHRLPRLDGQADRGARRAYTHRALDMTNPRSSRLRTGGEGVAHQAEDAAGAESPRSGQLEQYFTAGKSFHFGLIHVFLQDEAATAAIC